MRILCSLVVLCSLATSAAAQALPCAHPHYEQLYDGSLAFSCVDEPHADLFHALIAGGIALQGADAMQTAYVIGAGLGHEVNPVLQPFSDHPAAFGAVKLGIAALSSWAIVKSHQSPKYRWVAVAMLIEEYAVETYCVVHNESVLRRVR